jgi:hypothetical protein
MARRIFERTMDKALRQVETDRTFGAIRDVKPSGSQWRDVYCADGVIASGNRIVKPGGVLHFGGTRWQDDALTPSSESWSDATWATCIAPISRSTGAAIRRPSDDC